MSAELHTPLQSPQPLLYHDSPFSDYFTESPMDSSTHAPTVTQRKVVQRLNNIAARILRKEPTENTYDLLHKNIDSIEEALGEVVSQTRQPADIGDSGLFMPDDDDNDNADDDPFSPPTFSSPAPSDKPPAVLDSPPLTRTDSAQSHSELAPSPASTSSADALSSTARALLTRVTNAASQLRCRLAEVQHAHDVHIEQLDAASHEILGLRSANEALRQDLAFDHSELLFLKLQLRALEVQVRPAEGEGQGQWEREGEREKERDFERDVERWKKDWGDVEGRLRERMRRVGCGGEVRGGDGEDEVCAGWRGSEWEGARSGVQSGAVRPMGVPGETKEEAETGYDKMGLGGSLDGVPDDGTEDGTQTTLVGENGDDDEVEKKKDEDDTGQLSKKTPLQELWESLMALAGISDY